MTPRGETMIGRAITTNMVKIKCFFLIGMSIMEIRINKYGNYKYTLKLEHGININFDFYENILGDIALRTKDTHVGTILDKKTVIEFEEKMEEIEDPLDANEIDENLYYPNEDISEKLETKKEIDDIEIAKEIREIARYQRNFKTTIKNRIKENNGQPWTSN